VATLHCGSFLCIFCLGCDWAATRGEECLGAETGSARYTAEDIQRTARIQSETNLSTTV